MNINVKLINLKTKQLTKLENDRYNSCFDIRSSTRTASNPNQPHTRPIRRQDTSRLQLQRRTSHEQFQLPKSWPTPSSFRAYHKS